MEGAAVPGLLEVTRSHLENLAREISFLLYDSPLNAYIDPAWVSYASTIVLAASLVYIGSHSTLEKPSNALMANRNHPLFDSSDKDETYVEETAIDEQHAVLMPIVASIALVGLYYALKNWDPATISRYLNVYLTLVGVKAGAFTATYLITVAVRNICHRFGISSLRFNKRYTLTFSKDTELHPAGVERNYLLPEQTEREKTIREEMLLESRSDIKKENQLVNYYLTTADIYGTLFGVGFSTIYTLFDGSSNWILGNMFGAFFTIFGISAARLTSFKPAVIILVLFFFYDIYFVFGSEVMIKVATSIEIPVKMSIPTNVSRAQDRVAMSILGLGDMVIPGMFISLCLRFDLFNHHERNPNSEFYHLRKFSKPYFTNAMVAYNLGLLATVIALHIYGHGQPALLYLSPSLLLSLFIMAAYKGDLKRIWRYFEDPESDSVNTDLEVEILCSKETLFLAGSIDSEDENDESDETYQPDFASESESDIQEAF